MTSLSIHGLRKTFGARTALDDVTFKVRAGEIFGFVGSNGAGKTTTMRSILGVIEIDAGEVSVDNAPITAADRRRIGYMPEERGLYPKMQVADQLTYLARLHGFSKPQAQAAAETWTERLGIAERRNDAIDSLSLGNQQRVQLAAALVHDPSLLVLDEPFSGLDPVAVGVMSDVLREAADRGTPVLFSSHQLELVERVCDRVGIIRAGRMVAVGTVDELRADAPLRYRIVARGLHAGWAAELPGVVEEHTDESGATVELQRDASAAQAENRTVSSPSVSGVGVVGAQSTLVNASDLDIREAALLRHAVAQGNVTEFSRIRPNLTDLYREAVAA